MDFIFTSFIIWIVTIILSIILISYISYQIIKYFESVADMNEVSEIMKSISEGIGIEQESKFSLRAFYFFIPFYNIYVLIRTYEHLPRILALIENQLNWKRQITPIIIEDKEQ